MDHLWTWLILGLIPYSIKRRQKAREWVLSIHALFWSLEISGHEQGRIDWVLRIPLIEHFGS